MRQQLVLNTIKMRKKKGNFNMSEVIKRFVGKKCIITTMNEIVTGVIDAVEDNCIIVSPTGNVVGTEIISIDYISRVREYPKNKNGKEKSIIAG